MLRGVLAKLGIAAAGLCMMFVMPVNAGAADSDKISVTSVTSEQKVSVSLSEASWYGNDMSVTCYEPGSNTTGSIADNMKSVVWLDQIKAASSFSFVINKPVVAGEYRLVLGCNGSRLEKSFVFGTADIKQEKTDNLTGHAVKLASPTGIKAGQTAAAAVKITWKAVDRVAGYEVYRKTSVKGNYVKLGSTSGTSYTDKKVKAGKTYYYAVLSKSSGGNNIEDSSMSSPVKVSVLAAPKVKVKAGKKSVNVSWKKITGAKGYKVYISAKKKSGYKLKATVKGKKKTSCNIKKLKSGKSYYVKVAAYTGSGKKTVAGSKSAAAKVKVK